MNQRLGARQGAKLSRSTSCNHRFRRRIDCRYHLPSLVSRENQHAVDLKRTDPLDQADEHGYARNEQAYHQPATDERNFSRTVTVYPSERCERIEKSGCKYPECMR